MSKSLKSLKDALTVNYLIPLPDVDEWGVPKSKMPNCPHCGEDELSLTAPPNEGICYRCGALIVRAKREESITAQLVKCGQCSWRGRVGALEVDDDSTFNCPQCLRTILIQS